MADWLDDIGEALRVVRWRPGDAVPTDPIAFLRELEGPTLLHVQGRDSTRCRVVTTLLHGNEPSGLFASHRWLARHETPAVDMVLIVAAVRAALHEPVFGHRMLPGRRDLNRCFAGPFDGAEGALAKAILGAIELARPEAVVDIHNTSGVSPTYGVSMAANEQTLALTALFGDLLFETAIQLGALLNVTHASFPTVTIECGRGTDPHSHTIAHQGLCRFADAQDVFALNPAIPPPRVLSKPVRVRLRNGAQVSFAEQAAAGAALTLRHDLDLLNHEPTPPGTTIGWLGHGAELPIDAIDEEGIDRAEEFFVRDGEKLKTRLASQLFMVTLDPVIAFHDCLFYIVKL